MTQFGYKLFPSRLEKLDYLLSVQKNNIYRFYDDINVQPIPW